MLDVSYPDPIVREFICRQLNRMNDYMFDQYMLQMVQTIKYVRGAKRKLDPAPHLHRRRPALRPCTASSLGWFACFFLLCERAQTRPCAASAPPSICDPALRRLLPRFAERAQPRPCAASAPPLVRFAPTRPALRSPRPPFSRAHFARANTTMRCVPASLPPFRLAHPSLVLAPLAQVRAVPRQPARAHARAESAAVAVQDRTQLLLAPQERDAQRGHLRQVRGHAQDVRLQVRAAQGAPAAAGHRQRARAGHRGAHQDGAQGAAVQDGRGGAQEGACKRGGQAARKRTYQHPPPYFFR